MKTEFSKNRKGEWEHILLLGCDAQTPGKYERSDTIILASFHAGKRLLKLTSIMRDIRVDIPGHGEGKLNSAVVFGGPKLSMRIIGEMLDIPLRYYAMINMEGLVKVFDALGGIDICIDDNELDFINENTPDVQRIIQNESVIEPLNNSGQVHLCGAQTLAYMRDRRHGYDYARTARQRKVLGIALQKVKADMRFKMLLRTALYVHKHVKHNIPVYKLAELFLQIRKTNTGQVESLRLPAEGTYEVIHSNIWHIRADFKKNTQVFKAFLEKNACTQSAQQMKKTDDSMHRVASEINPDYKKWKQTDAYLNEKEAWPASVFPEAEYHYFSECGCVVSALAMMLRRYEIEQQVDPTKFNPWILNERLIKCGAFNAAADLMIADIDLLYNLEYAGSVPYSREKLIEACHSEEPFLITVRGNNAPCHFIVPDYLTEEDFAVMDSASQKQFLSEFEEVLELRLFRKTGRMIALTFDDGPGFRGETEIILDALEKYHAKATFFTVGNRLLTKSESLKRKLEMGCEIGSHTWDHDRYGEDVTKEDIVKCNAIIKEITGHSPTCFRSPGGATNAFIQQVCKEEGLPLFYWSVDTKDWKYRDGARLYEEVILNTRDGDIVLMHEIYESTAMGLEAVLQALSKRGFSFVTCSELVLAKTGKPPEPGIQYGKNGNICNDTK